MLGTVKVILLQHFGHSQVYVQGSRYKFIGGLCSGELQISLCCSVGINGVIGGDMLEG